MRTTLRKYNSIIIPIAVAIITFVLGLVLGGVLVNANPTSFAGAAGALANSASCVAFSSSDPSQTGIVLADPLNFRLGPGLNYPIVTTLDYCTKVELIGRNEDSSWLTVRVNGSTEGWVFAYYIYANMDISNLEISTAYGGPATGGSASGSPTIQVYIEYNQAVAFVGGLPANAEAVALLAPTTKAAARGLEVASGYTDANGNITLLFQMPSTWADGSTLESGKMTLKVTAGGESITAAITYYN